MQITILSIDLEDQETVNIEVNILHENSMTIKNLLFPAEVVHECLLENQPSVLETMIAETVLDMIELQQALNQYCGRRIEVDSDTSIVAVAA